MDFKKYKPGTLIGHGTTVRSDVNKYLTFHSEYLQVVKRYLFNGSDVVILPSNQLNMFAEITKSRIKWRNAQDRMYEPKKRKRRWVLYRHKRIRFKRYKSSKLE